MKMILNGGVGKEMDKEEIARRTEEVVRRYERGEICSEKQLDLELLIAQGAEPIRVDISNLITGRKEKLHFTGEAIRRLREIEDAKVVAGPKEVNGLTLEPIWTPEGMLAAFLEYKLGSSPQPPSFRRREPQYDPYYVEYYLAFMQGKRGKELAKVKKELRDRFVESQELKVYEFQREKARKKLGRNFIRVMERRLLARFGGKLSP